jgi:hypothetical protein
VNPGQFDKTLACNSLIQSRIWRRTSRAKGPAESCRYDETCASQCISGFQLVPQPVEHTCAESAGPQYGPASPVAPAGKHQSSCRNSRCTRIKVST